MAGREIPWKKITVDLINSAEMTDLRGGKASPDR